MVLRQRDPAAPLEPAVDRCRLAPRHVRFEGRALPEVLLTVANSFGADLKTLGRGDAQVTSELPGLRVM
jgi:hypothetical protein